MQIQIIQIGNSQGIIIPKSMLLQAGFNNKADIVLENGTIHLRPVKPLREGWEKAAQSLAVAGDDILLDAEYLDNLTDEQEWQW